MATFAKAKISGEYHGVICEHCGQLVVFEDDPGGLPEPFQMRCYKCGHMGTYAKQSLLSVRVERTH